MFKTLWQLFKLQREVREMTDVKTLLQSKTIWGIVIAILAMLAKNAGYTIDEAGTVNTIVEIIGLILGLYGRITATKQLKSVV